jgi:hypothetical protein
MVRPFFQTHGTPLTQEQQPEQQSEVKNETATSSEGFKFQAPSVRQGAPNNNANVVNNIGPPANVMAGPKRQHPRGEESSASSSSGGKRVRIQEQMNQNQHRREVQVLQEHGPAGDVLPLARQQQQQEMSSSSSSSGGRAQQLAQGHHGVPPRVVTDVSSSNRTDSAVSNPNTSGSGSAGNSGNDNKGSSEDRVKEGDNSGEATNDGSDGAGSEGKKKILLGLDNNVVVHRHDAVLPEQATSDDMGTKGTGPTRERKLIDKKRKRIEMRREYEAQQQPSESSASSASKGDHLLRPGKAVSMDEVLFLSKIPR